MKKILITGASGFIGQNLIKKSLKLKYLVYGITRKTLNFENQSNLKFFLIDNLNSKEKLNEALKGVDCVIHCAGKTNLSTKIESFNLVNVLFTKNLAECAVNAGVKRFIFLSFKYISINTPAIVILYHTKDIASRLMSSPKIAVNPAINTKK